MRMRSKAAPSVRVWLRGGGDDEGRKKIPAESAKCAEKRIKWLAHPHQPEEVQMERDIESIIAENEQLRADCWRMRMVARCSIAFLFVFALPLVVALQLHYERRLDECKRPIDRLSRCCQTH